MKITRLDSFSFGNWNKKRLLISLFLIILVILFLIVILVPYVLSRVDIANPVTREDAFFLSESRWTLTAEGKAFFATLAALSGAEEILFSFEGEEFILFLLSERGVWNTDLVFSELGFRFPFADYYIYPEEDVLILSGDDEVLEIAKRG